MEIQLKKLDVSNFRLITNTSIDFTNRNGLISLVGHNKKVFSSNSSGKSTLGLAIDMALYSKNRLGLPIKDLRRNHSKIEPNLLCEFTKGEDSFKVMRGGKDVALFVNGKRVIEGKSSVDSTLQTYLDIPFNIYSQLTYLTNTTKVFFTESDTRGQSDLLIELLDMAFIPELAKKSHEKITLLQKDISHEIDKRRQFEQQIDNLDLSLKTLLKQAPKPDMSKEIELQEYLDNLKLSKADFKAKQVKITEELDEIRARLNSIKGEKVAVNRDINNKKELSHLPSCPTCGQDIPSDIDDTIKSTQDILRGLEELEVELKESLVPLNLQASSYSKEINRLTNSINNKEKELVRLEEMRTNAEKADKSFELREQFELQRKKALKDLVKLKLTIDKLEDELYIYKLIKSVSQPKGFITQRIELFINLFNGYLIELSEQLLDGMSCQVREIKERTYAVMVNHNGLDMSFNELSSGLQARVRIICTVAINEAIQYLTGISFNFLFLDEVLANIDELDGIERLLDKLKRKYPTKMIFIVTHEKTISNADHTLVAERDELGTTFKWI